MASADLIWGIVRNRSAFLIKRNGVQMTSEPGNLMNVNSFRNSGLANSQTIGVSVKGNKAEMTLKTKAAVNKPSKATATVALRKGPVRSIATIDANTGKSFYRRDLTATAQARYSRINRAAARAAKGITKKEKGKGRRGRR